MEKKKHEIVESREIVESIFKHEVGDRVMLHQFPFDAGSFVTGIIRSRGITDSKPCYQVELDGGGYATVFEDAIKTNIAKLASVNVSGGPHPYSSWEGSYGKEDAACKGHAGSEAKVVTKIEDILSKEAIKHYAIASGKGLAEPDDQVLPKPLPCPFCANEHMIDRREANQRHVCVCPVCDAEGPAAISTVGARRRWNEREYKVETKDTKSTQVGDWVECLSPQRINGLAGKLTSISRGFDRDLYVVAYPLCGIVEHLHPDSVKKLDEAPEPTDEHRGEVIEVSTDGAEWEHATFVGRGKRNGRLEDFFCAIAVNQDQRRIIWDRARRLR